MPSQSEQSIKCSNGVNSRALQALRIIGAATFRDNPRDEQEIKENLYDYLNLPEFNISVPSHYHAFISPIEDYEEKGSFIMMGMVKSKGNMYDWVTHMHTHLGGECGHECSYCYLNGKGFGKGRKSILKGLKQQQITGRKLIDNKPKAHNGCRAKKKRRL